MSEPNVQEAVPFFQVADIEASLRFYVDGLGFEITRRWVVDGRLRWCWLQNGGAALMLQEAGDHGSAVVEGKAGLGVSIYFICRDALAIYREVSLRGVRASTPFVGNQMWVTSMVDPDGYKIAFESPTDAPEESTYTE